LTKPISADHPSGHGVRLKYASLIVYVLNIAGAIFALYFATLLTHKVSQEDYGNYIMIMRYISYFLIPSAIYNYWISRNISRGQNTSRTGIYASAFFATGSLPIYLAVVWVASSTFNQPILPLILSAGILFLSFINGAVTQVSGGYAPQYVGYTTFALKLVQAGSAYLIIGLWALGLTGAMISIVIANGAATVLNFYLNRSIIRKSKFDRTVFLSWIKCSWLPLFWSISSIIAIFDVIIVRFFYQSAIPIAFYGVVTSVMGVSLFSNVVISSLYPKIVAKKNTEDLKEALWLMLLLTFPVIYTIILYAKPICALFGADYLTDALPLIVFAVASVIQVIANLASNVYQALESSDENCMSAASLRKSALFKANAVILVSNIFYLVLITLLSSMGISIILFVELWCASVGAADIFQFLVTIYLVKRDFQITFPLKPMLQNFIFMTLPLPAMVVPSFFIKVSITGSVYQTLYSLIPPVVLSLTLYLLILSVIDIKFRNMIGQILNQIGIFKSRNVNKK
jgi:O-antigen/teichoic acid export membrane protein